MMNGWQTTVLGILAGAATLLSEQNLLDLPPKQLALKIAIALFMAGLGWFAAVAKKDPPAK